MLSFCVDKKYLTKIIEINTIIYEKKVINQIKASVPDNDTFEDQKYCCFWDGVYYKDYE